MPEVGEDAAMTRGDGYNGADLVVLVREVGVRALRSALGALDEMDSRPGPDLW